MGNAVIQQSINDNSFSNQASSILNNAKERPHITKLDNNTPTSPEMARKLAQENQDHFLAMLLAGIKNQTPDDPYDTDQITQTSALLTQTQQVINQTSVLREIADNLKNNGMDREHNYIDQEVYYDVSNKEFQGLPLEYEYNVEYDNSEYDNPNHYQLKSNISIFDKDNNMMFETVNLSEVRKHNSFIWQGKTTDKLTGKETYVPADHYRMKVTTEIIDTRSANRVSIGVPSDTNKCGIVQEVVNENGKFLLKVGKDLISSADITKIRKPSNNPATDYLQNINYIGKKVSLIDSQTTVSNGYADIKFQNNFSNYGNGLIKIKAPGQNSYVTIGMIDREHITPGSNNYSWQALRAESIEDIQQHYKYKDSENSELSAKYRLPNLGDGNYQYEIYIEDLNESAHDKFKLLNNNITGVVSAVEQRAQQTWLTVDNKQYPLNRIVKVEEASMADKNLYGAAAGLIGRSVTFDNNYLTLTNNNNVSFNLNSNNNELYYGAELRVFDLENNLLTSLKKSAAELVTSQQITVPQYAELAAESRKKIDMFIRESAYDLDSHYANLTAESTEQLTKKITEILPGKSYNDLTAVEKNSKLRDLFTEEFIPDISIEQLDHPDKVEASSIISRAENAEPANIQQLLKQHYTTNNLYANLASSRKELVKQEITTRYIAGELHNDMFTELTPAEQYQDKAARQGRNNFSWSSKINNNHNNLCRYELYITQGPAADKTQLVKTNNQTQGLVEEVRLSDGNYDFIIKTGDQKQQIHPQQLIAING